MNIHSTIQEGYDKTYWEQESANLKNTITNELHTLQDSNRYNYEETADNTVNGSPQDGGKVKDDKFQQCAQTTYQSYQPKLKKEKIKPQQREAREKQRYIQSEDNTFNPCNMKIFEKVLLSTLTVFFVFNISMWCYFDVISMIVEVTNNFCETLPLLSRTCLLKSQLTFYYKLNPLSYLSKLLFIEPNYEYKSIEKYMYVYCLINILMILILFLILRQLLLGIHQLQANDIKRNDCLQQVLKNNKESKEALRQYEIQMKKNRKQNPDTTPAKSSNKNKRLEDFDIKQQDQQKYIN